MIAKRPQPGRSKTRLCPPCTPEEAAVLAEAALADTLDAVSRTPAQRRVLCLEGEPGGWVPPGFEVVTQRGEGLGERLAAAFEDAGTPALLVGMDTPQVTPDDLAPGLDALDSGGVDAVLGPAPDGGYWAVGLRAADPRVFAGVPMSSNDTARAQLARMGELGLRVSVLHPLRDVDHFDDALAVASEAVGTRFAAAVRALGRQLDPRT